MISRDLVQGFIDGYITTGGDPAALDSAVSQYLSNHPTYPQSVDNVQMISTDLNTYRVTAQEVLAPTPVTMAPVKVQ